MISEELQQEYGPDYYATGCGPIPYERSAIWIDFFSNVADQVVRALHPRRVLDAGCAMGFLVEALWDRGVYCEGIDISEYAISKVRRDVREYCSVGSVTDPIAGRFDLITCIEVLEHLRPELVRRAVGNLCTGADQILFSSTPSDMEEPTHHSVRPSIYWLRLFSEFDFWPDARFDASFLTMHAMLFRKGPPPSDDFLHLFSENVRHKTTIGIQSKEVPQLNEKLRALRQQIEELERSLHTKESELVSARHERDHLATEFSFVQRHLTALQTELPRRLTALQSELSLRNSELVEVKTTLKQSGARVAELQSELTKAAEVGRDLSAQNEAKRSEHQKLKQRLIAEVRAQRAARARLKGDLQKLECDRADLEVRLNNVISSRAWKLVEKCRWPLRKIRRTWSPRPDDSMGSEIQVVALDKASNPLDPELREGMELIRTSLFFDANWYCEQYPDVAAADIDPVLHYLRYGAAERRNPGPDFDGGWYLETHPDVAAAGFNPLLHYLLFGEFEGREVRPVAADQVTDPADAELQRRIDVIRGSPLFNADWYLEQYPDVAAAAVDPAVHYAKYGAAEERNPGPDFDCRWYLKTNTDVAAAGINPLLHYVLFGKTEGREIRAISARQEADFRNVRVDVSPEIKKFALLIGGCPGDAYRYRVEYQAEQFKLLGLTVDAALFDLVDYSTILSEYRLFILHRVPHTPGIEAFITKAKSSGKPVIFDTDDLVFNESIIDQIKGIRDFPPSEYELYVDGVRRYYRTMSLCTSVTVTTEHLRDSVRELFPGLPVWINRNAMGKEMIKLAENALREILPPADSCVRIAYFSGTRTHQDDFEQCVPALARLLAEHSSIRLMIIGHLDIPAALAQFAEQIEITPLVPWQDLPRLFRRVDINLAPLELANRFTAAKSELKYFEAGLLGVPTVASDVDSYRVAITPGENGFLCRDDKGWYETLESLALDRNLRRRTGENARRDVLARYTTRSRAPELARQLRQIFDSHNLATPDRLTIAFVLRAPIARTGGGYKTIFSIAHQLAERGHHVHLYVEPIAHLAGKTNKEIGEFCNEYFGKGPAIIHVGHDAIQDSDVAIATNWPTAYVVEQLSNTRCRAYFIQDYEPDFYDKTAPQYAEADRTYDLPFRKIVIGKYLSGFFSERDGFTPYQIPFALDRHSFRNLGIRPPTPPIRILFFARPGLKRRAYPVGIEALRRVAGAYPDIEIALYGMAERQDLGFHYENLGELSRSEVVREMNRSHIHLSFSLTNISWVPFEAMACGCAVVEAKVPSVELWMKEDTCLLVDPRPETVASALAKLIRDSRFRDTIAKNGEQYVGTISSNWHETCSQFESILRESVY